MKRIIASFFFLCLLSLSTPLPSQTRTYAERQREKREKRKEGENYGYGSLALFVGCFAIGIWLKQRQLKRTNQYGTEVFSTTRQYFGDSAMEGLANFAAVVLFAGGIILMMTAAIKCNS